MQIQGDEICLPCDREQRAPHTTDDSTGFERRFAGLRKRVAGYLFRLTGSRADAEDLAQETLLAAFQQRERFRPGSAPLPYLLGIARRRWLDRRRSQHETSELCEDAVPGSDATPQWIDALTLRAAMVRLSEAERQALQLTAIEGHTFKEAAAILGEPVGTLKWRVHEAVRKLRRHLADPE